MELAKRSREVERPGIRPMNDERRLGLVYMRARKSLCLHTRVRLHLVTVRSGSRLLLVLRSEGRRNRAVLGVTAKQRQVFTLSPGR